VTHSSNNISQLISQRLAPAREDSAKLHAVFPCDRSSQVAAARSDTSTEDNEVKEKREGF